MQPARATLEHALFLIAQKLPGLCFKLRCQECTELHDTPKSHYFRNKLSIRRGNIAINKDINAPQINDPTALPTRKTKGFLFRPVRHY